MKFKEKSRVHGLPNVSWGSSSREDNSRSAEDSLLPTRTENPGKQPDFFGFALFSLLVDCFVFGLLFVGSVFSFFSVFLWIFWVNCSVFLGFFSVSSWVPSPSVNLCFFTLYFCSPRFFCLLLRLCFSHIYFCFGS